MFRVRRGLRSRAPQSKKKKIRTFLPKKSVLAFTWPGPSFPFNVRAFDASGKLLPSITNGAIVERANYRPRTGPAAGNDLPLKTRWESITASAGGVSVSGWVVDPALVGGGLASVEVEIYIDYRYAHARVCTRSCR